MSGNSTNIHAWVTDARQLRNNDKTDNKLQKKHEKQTH